MNKNFLAEVGSELMTAWCEENNIELPELHLYHEESHPEAKKIKAVATCGYYRRGHIHVSIPACAHKNPGYSWPGFISDRTPYGVIQHELGHHIDQVKSGLDVYRNRSGRFFSDTIRAISKEPPITSYAPDTMEWFAEIFRLFVTNPDLLKRIRPKAYAAMISQGLKPYFDAPAERILTTWEAPPKVFERMQKWIEKSK